MPTRLATFEDVALKLIEETKNREALGECSRYLAGDYKQRLSAYAKPFFGKMPIAKIDFAKLRDFRATLIERGLKATTVNPIMSFVSMVLKFAADDGVIDKVPKVPRAKHKDCPRPAFSKPDYRKLLAFMKKVERQNPKIGYRAHVVDWEMRFMTTFMVNSVLRPGDLFKLKNKHVDIVPADDSGPAYLRLNAPASKGHSYPVITMPVAVKIYQRILARHTAAGFGNPEDFVFMPSIKNRRYAQETARREFTDILKACGIFENAAGEAYTMYSLRHTAIVLRLLNAKDLDLVTLARACRTSVEMIDRFYAKSLTAEMNRERLHSFRHKSRYV